MPVETVDRLADQLKSEAARVRADIDNFFARLLAPTGDGRERLYEAMRHAAIGGGKRLRPLLTIAASQLFAIDGLTTPAVIASKAKQSPAALADPRGIASSLRSSQ